MLNEGLNGGFGVYRPDALAAGSGCTGDDSMIEPATTPAALAQQLAALPGSTVVQPVALDARCWVATPCTSGCGSPRSAR